MYYGITFSGFSALFEKLLTTKLNIRLIKWKFYCSSHYRGYDYMINLKPKVLYLQSLRIYSIAYHREIVMIQSTNQRNERSQLQ